MAQFLTKQQRSEIQAQSWKLVEQVILDLGGVTRHILDVKKVVIKDHARRTATAGTATKAVIEINLHLNKTVEEYTNTILHEYAHCVCFVMFPKDNAHHGPNWKRVMVMLGQKPDRCHTQSLSELYPEKWRKVVCTDCGKDYEISKRKVNKVLREGQWYTCKCGQQLEILNAEEKKIAARRMQDDLKAVRPAHSMTCDKCNHTMGITKRRRNLILKGTKYTHRKCGGNFKL